MKDLSSKPIFIDELPAKSRESRTETREAQETPVHDHPYEPFPASVGTRPVAGEPFTMKTMEDYFIKRITIGNVVVDVYNKKLSEERRIKEGLKVKEL